MDAFVAGTFVRLVEHIASFVVKLMLERRLMDRGLVSSALTVLEQSMDCSGY